MSTASRYRETACGARAGNRNAVSVPGVSGKPRGHYDPRAERQVRESRGFPCKRKPEVEIAAPQGRAFMPIPFSASREPRLRHSPPFIRPPPGMPP